MCREQFPIDASIFIDIEGKASEEKNCLRSHLLSMVSRTWQLRRTEEKIDEESLRVEDGKKVK